MDPGDYGAVALAVVEELDEADAVLLVSPSLGDAVRVVEEVEGLGRNPFLVEATGIPEVMLSGLSLDEVIAYHVGLLESSIPGRRAARPRRPMVTRRELLRRAFMVEERYVLPPSSVEGCPDESCPLGAVRGGRLVLERCRGCLLCRHRCPGVRAPPVAGLVQLLYAYSYAAGKGLDGILVVCRSALPLLDRMAAEAGPARLLPFHVPCLGWLNPREARAVEEELGVPVAAYAPAQCEQRCVGGEEAHREIRGSLLASGVRVVESLAELSTLAYTGYTRRPLPPGEAVERVARRLGLGGAGEGG